MNAETDQRLAMLERRCRRLTAAVAVLGMSFVVVVCTALGPAADEVKARRFIVVDDKGAERAYFGISPLTSNQPWLEIKHRKPEDGTALGLSLDEAGENLGLSVRSKGAKATAQVEVRGKDNPSVIIEGPNLPNPISLR